MIRKRSVGNGFHEDLTVLNHGAEPIDLEVRVAASDFADLFEVKDALAKKESTTTGSRAAGLSWGIGASGSSARPGSRRALLQRSTSA